ncbi:MAG: hypothetical protein Q7U97_06735 [Rhodocyclaceae bacterium]|nr:hypothetical protein [Rhodocyclaceae bacterium]
MSLRTIHTDTSAAMAAPVFRPLAMVEMAFDSGTVYAHSAVGDVVWNGHTFKGVSWLGKIGAIQEGENLEAYGVQLDLSGVKGELVAISLNEHYRNRPLRIWIAFLNKQSRIVGDPVGPWRWDMSTLDGEFTGAKGTLILSSTSRMAGWERANESRYTDADQQARHPGDFFCEFASAAAEKEIDF